MNDINIFYNETPTRSKTRKSILSNSLELFASKGIESVSMAEISKLCGITTRNLYRYYSSKEFLVVDSTYEIFFRSINTPLDTSFNQLTGIKQLKVLMFNLIHLNQTKEDEIAFTKYIMYFDIYISTLSKDHPAFIKYTKEYLPLIESSKSTSIKNALKKGISDRSILINEEEITLYDTYITQSIFSLIMRINIKEYENESINPKLIYKHIEIILNHLGVNNE